MLSVFVVLGSFLLGSLAFDPSKDSCAPGDGTYEGPDSPDYTECTPGRLSVNHIPFNCGRHGTISYNYVANTIQLVQNNARSNGQFTIHGACYQKGRQIAHIDLYMPVATGRNNDHTYHGLNRDCLLTLPGMRLEIDSYTMDANAINRCAAHPIQPIT